MSDFPLSSGLRPTELLAGSAPLGSLSTSKGQLAHAAGEFESILLNQWLEGAESTFGSVPGGDEDQDPGDQQMKSFAVQALAKGITKAGGIGLAGVVSKALEEHAPNSARDEPGPRGEGR